MQPFSGGKVTFPPWRAALKPARAHMGAGIRLYRIDPLHGFHFPSAPSYRYLRRPGCLLAGPAYTQRWPNLSPNGWEAKRVGGTHPGSLCATLDSSRGPLETWEFPVGPGCPQRRPPVANPQRGFSTENIKREEAATEPGAPNLQQVGCRNGAPGPRQRRQQQHIISTSQI